MEKEDEGPLFYYAFVLYEDSGLKGWRFADKIRGCILRNTGF